MLGGNEMVGNGAKFIGRVLIPQACVRERFFQLGFKIPSRSGRR
jgi:hypothetical protein